MTEERKDFSTFQVEIAYFAQDGACHRCGASLEHGFHRHHKDNNPANTKSTNLELLCPDCHHKTYMGDKEELFKRHRKQELETLDSINRLIQEVFSEKSKITGATMERLVDAMTMGLRLSRTVTEYDVPEMPPASIRVLRTMANLEAQKEKYLEGFIDGMKARTNAT